LRYAEPIIEKLGLVTATITSESSKPKTALRAFLLALLVRLLAVQEVRRTHRCSDPASSLFLGLVASADAAE
jgi:hypothetical protein